MICDDAAVLVHALADGELDASHAREVETHVASCSACTAELAAAQDMKCALGASGLGFAAPASPQGPQLMLMAGSPSARR